MGDDELTSALSTRCPDDLRRRAGVAAKFRGQQLSDMIRDVIEAECDRLGVTMEVVELIEDEGYTIPEALEKVENESQAVETT